MRQEQRLHRGQDESGQADQDPPGQRANPDCHADPGRQQRESEQLEALASLVDKFDHSIQRKAEPSVRIA